MANELRRTPVTLALVLAAGIAVVTSITTFVPGSHAEQPGWRSRVAPPAVAAARTRPEDLAGATGLSAKGYQATMPATIGLYLARAGQ